MNKTIIGSTNLLVCLWALLPLFRISMYQMFDIWTLLPLCLVLFLNLIFALVSLMKAHHGALAIGGLTIMFASLLYLSHANLQITKEHDAKVMATAKIRL